MKFNKAAMFGLDARIALAIFGALSVISGAALYSSIQSSKVTALIADLNEVTKAYDAYYLDVVENLDIVNSNVFLKIEELVSSSKNGWQGPYISYPVDSSHSLDCQAYSGYVYLSDALDGNWTDNTPSSWPAFGTAANCASGTVGGNCFVWVVISGLSQDIYNAVDLQIDGAVNGQQGNIRYIQTSGGALHLFMKHRATL